MKVQLAHYTDRGTTNPVNEDSFVIRTADTVNGPVVMAAICDGMGGLSKGELASSTAVQELSAWFDERLPLLIRSGYNFSVLRSGVEFIIRSISSLIENYASHHHVRMGTTLTMLLSYDGHCVTANVGDSRVYKIDDNVCQMTKDQTVVQNEIDRGNLTSENAEKDKRRGILLQCIGETAGLVPDIRESELSLGAVYLLCSDGFRHKIQRDELQKELSPSVISNEKDLINALTRLTRVVIERGETDNITSLTIRVVE